MAGNHNSGRKGKEPEKRISGTYDLTTTEGKQGASHLKYRKNIDENTAEIDTEKISEIVNSYIDMERRTKTRTINYKNGTSIEEEYEVPISKAGLRIALGDIDPETYELWLRGYVNRDHVADTEHYTCNISLSRALRAGENEIARYWTEREANGSGSSKDIAILQAMGEVQSKEQSKQTINIGTLGSLKMFGH